jgi:hypothetical protein
MKAPCKLLRPPPKPKLFPDLEDFAAELRATLERLAATP